MKYTKTAKSFGDQAQLLIDRGFMVANKQELENYLKKVNYYRLSGYWYSFKVIDPISGNESFKPGTSFDSIRERYEFDRQLRLLLMDSIERIEVAILRTRMVELHTRLHGPFGYTNLKSFDPKFSKKSFQNLLNDILDDETRSHEEFIQRYRHKYTGEKYLPLWMAVEIMSFGQLFTLYRNSEHAIKKSISSEFNLFPPVFDSWLHSLNYIRNACAHHMRLWNRPLPVMPWIPRKKHDPRWQQPIPIGNTRVFIILTIIRYLLNTLDSGNRWNITVMKLLKNYPNIPLQPMGFPKRWQEIVFWK